MKVSIYEEKGVSVKKETIFQMIKSLFGYSTISTFHTMCTVAVKEKKV